MSLRYGQAAEDRHPHTRSRSVGEQHGVCPVCGSTSPDVLFVVSSHQVARHFFRDEHHPRYRRLADRVEALWHRPTCEFLRCSQCDFSFADPFTAGDDEFYRIAYGEGVRYPDWKWEFQRTLEEIESLCHAAIRARWVRRLLKFATVPPMVLLSFGALISLRSQELGTALWIHLQRKDERDRCRSSS